MPKKRCSKCREFKALENFYKDEKRKDKKSLNCKECMQKYYQENREKIVEKVKKYYQENKEKIIEQKRKYYQENKEYKKEYCEKNKKKRNQYSREYYQINRKKHNQYTKQYYQEHKKEIFKKHKQYYQIPIIIKKRNQNLRIKYITDSWFRLNNLMSQAIQKVKNPSIKQGQSWKDLVPYTLTELRKHLKRSIPKGYTWKDFMKGKLHIDHILPKAIFQYEKAEDLAFQICWGLDNLRLLPSGKNLRKGTKLIKPFQKNFNIEVEIKKRKDIKCIKN